MWNRPALFLWVSVRVEPPPGSGRRGFSLSLPVPVYLLFGVLDFAEDAFDVLSLFPGARRMLRERHAREAKAALRALVLELLHLGRTDLADVDVTEGTGRRVRVRCLLR